MAGQKILVILVFTLNFWTERRDGREYIMLDLIGGCLNPACGGRLHLVVSVGYIEDGDYRVKTSKALWGNETSELRKKFTCTNGDITVQVHRRESEEISKKAERFAIELREVRMAAKASLN